jgi:hypothetical protein
MQDPSKIYILQVAGSGEPFLLSYPTGTEIRRKYVDRPYLKNTEHRTGGIA